LHHRGYSEGKRKRISPQRVQRGKEEKDFTTEGTARERGKRFHHRAHRGHREKDREKREF
jgi:hypothetical protein